ncbi:hypothetical protein OAA60_03445 [Porticoccaceae bacterium]|nr:hypothetical protein [Porticoccaceae bacterium]
MMKSKAKSLYWFVEFPVQQYNEDVVELARVKGVEIVDARFKDTISPELALSDEASPKLTKITKVKSK